MPDFENDVNLVGGSLLALATRVSLPTAPSSGIKIFCNPTNSAFAWMGANGVANTVQKAITVGTAAPSGGQDGDIYIQIT